MTPPVQRLPTIDADPRKPTCLPCRHGRHVGCLWATRPCGCLCPWLVADLIEHFPSLRRAALEEAEQGKDDTDGDSR